jgi:SAM-dependent methyltransferase
MIAQRLRTLEHTANIESLLEELVDPKDRQPLRRETDAFVNSTDATRRYPVLRGIPRFVETDNYVSSFSFEWNTHKTTQLDVYRGDRSSEDQFIQKTGFSPDFLRGKLVLDAGVGAGRYADVASRWGADLVGIDLSFAVEAAHNNFQDRRNVVVMQADIARLPFAPGTFDVIFSIGVLHHTPDTRRYFRSLVPLLKPGGTIAIWVYPNEGDYLTRAQWIPFTSRIPSKMFYEWCRWFVPLAQRLPRNRVVGLLRRTFPFSHQGLGLENDVLDTFDGYSPVFHWLHSPEEVRGWFSEEGLQEICEPSGWHTCVRGTKPR